MLWEDDDGDDDTDTHYTKRSKTTIIDSYFYFYSYFRSIHWLYCKHLSFANSFFFFLLNQGNGFKVNESINFVTNFEMIVFRCLSLSRCQWWWLWSSSIIIDFPITVVVRCFMIRFRQWNSPTTECLHQNESNRWYLMKNSRPIIFHTDSFALWLQSSPILVRVLI